jgi:fibronectin type 3 domain-containing protein
MDAAVVNGTTYYYVVTAYDTSLNEGDNSSEASATPETVDTVAPAAPTGLVAVAGDGEVSLSWDANGESDLSGYKVYRSTTSGGPYTEIADVVANAYMDAAVVNGTTYYYVVTAYDTSLNEGDNSSEASATRRV